MRPDTVIYKERWENQEQEQNSPKAKFYDVLRIIMYYLTRKQAWGMTAHTISISPMYRPICTSSFSEEN